MTKALEGGEWSAACPGCTLPPRKTRYPFYRRLGGPQGWSGQWLSDLTFTAKPHQQAFTASAAVAAAEARSKSFCRY